AARFENGELVEKPRATVYLNGVKIHEDKEIQQVWGGPNSGRDGGNDGGKGITDMPGGLKLQAEGHDVYYRNIWMKKLDLDGKSTDFYNGIAHHKGPESKKIQRLFHFDFILLLKIYQGCFSPLEF